MKKRDKQAISIIAICMVIALCFGVLGVDIMLKYFDPKTDVLSRLVYGPVAFVMLAFAAIAVVGGASQLAEYVTRRRKRARVRKRT